MDCNNIMDNWKADRSVFVQVDGGVVTGNRAGPPGFMQVVGGQVFHALHLAVVVELLLSFLFLETELRMVIGRLHEHVNIRHCLGVQRVSWVHSLVVSIASIVACQVASPALHCHLPRPRPIGLLRHGLLVSIGMGEFLGVVLRLGWIVLRVVEVIEVGLRSIVLMMVALSHRLGLAVVKTVLRSFGVIILHVLHGSLKGPLDERLDVLADLAATLGTHCGGADEVVGHAVQTSLLGSGTANREDFVGQVATKVAFHC